MRKVAIILIIFAALFCISACQKLGLYTQTEIDEKDDQVTSLEAKLQLAKENADELEVRLGDLQNASEELQGNVERLESENWRDVVPDIESSSQDVESAQEEAATASEDLSSALNE